jgi:phosphomannomutase / phosphoglucomutase
MKVSEVKVDLGVPGSTEVQYAVAAAEEIPHGVFRTYDIRGAVGPDSINANLAYAIGLVFGSMAMECEENTVVIGRDGRLSGQELQQALMAGLCASGRDVIDIGVVSSPILYFATSTLNDTSTGIMVTASHNPAGDNGFKLVLNGVTLTAAGVQDIYQRILRRDFTEGCGSCKELDIVEDYISYIVTNIELERPLKVVVDCGNGVGAVAGPEILKRLGCEVIELYCEVDGRFPNHHPDPTVPKNLVDIIAKVKSEQADLGLAFDGDADRIGVITNTGDVIWPDRQMMLFARDCLNRYPGEKIIFDVKCSSHLPAIISQHGGDPVMYKTGHSLIKAKMKELKAPLAGEMSGHIFFNDEWFGFDDGVYVGARLLRILSSQALNASELFDTLPSSVNTPELKLPMPEDKKAAFMQSLLDSANFGECDRITIDGLRLDFGFGWGLIRPSNTSAYLIIRFEAETDAQLLELKSIFARELLAVEPSLQLPFEY